MTERGAILIHVTLALLALLAFSSVIVDYGVMWVSRRQAQNAADAAAMAGARSLPINGGQNADATAAALAFARLAPVWGQRPTAANVVVSPLPFTCPADAGAGSCIRVDVMRGAPDHAGTAHNNTLPVFFGRLVGVTPQGVRATATAQAAPGNAVQCIKPWLVADRWLEGNPPPWSQSSTFNPPVDTYVPPSSPGTTGFTVSDNYGLQLVLKPGVIGTWSAGWTRDIDLGVPTSEEQISGCPSFVPTVGVYNPSVGPCANTTDATDPARGCVKVRTNMSRVTEDGVSDLVALDDDAVWDAGTKTVIEGGRITPRIVPIAFFNTQVYHDEASISNCDASGCVAQVVNIMGFFVEGMCNTVTLDPGVTCPNPSSDVVGRLMNYPGQFSSVAGSVTPSASFLTVTRLVR
jgi:hypothetical protein